MNLLQKIIYWAILLIVVTIAVYPLLSGRTYTFHDEPQIANLQQFIKMVDAGNIPVRWSPDVHFNYGSPYPQFNYQLPYYLGYIFHSLGNTLFHSYSLILVFSAFLGAIGMFLLAQQLLPLNLSLVAATLYTFTPYHAVDLYVRGTIGESMALGILPWILLFLYRLFKQPNLVDTILLSIFSSLLVVSHQPTTVLVLPIIYIIFGLSALISKKSKTITCYISAIPLVFCLTSFYILPVLFETKYIQPNAQFNLYDHFPFIKQLIIPSWGYGASIWGPDDDMSFQIGPINILAILLSTVLLFTSWTKTKKGKNWLAIITLFGTFLFIFLMNIRSSFFWEVFPYSQSIQFPWRLLAPVSLLTVFLFILACSSKVIKQNSTVISLVLMAVILVMNVNYFKPGDYFVRSDDYYLRLYLPNKVLKPKEVVSEDYLKYDETGIPLPVNAIRPKTIPPKVTSINPSTEIKTISNDPLDYQIEVEASKEDVISFNTYYFPGWQVSGSIPDPKLSTNDIGAMTLSVPSGSSKIRFYYSDTPIRHWGNKISLVTVTLIFILLPIRLISWTKKIR